MRWVEEVLAPQPRVAVFDCDGTLWGGDAGSGFMRWSMETGLLGPERAEWLRERYRLYEAGQVDEVTICGEMVQVYAGLPEAEARAAARRFFAEEVEGRIFPELEELVRELRRGGTDIWAVSSTWNLLIEAAVGERFGIRPERVLAAEVRVRDGRVTDELLAVPTDEAKATALREAGVARPDAVFGNSVHDLAMLAMAERAYPVNPTEGLLGEAGARGWAIFWPHGTGPKRESTEKEDLMGAE